MALTRLAHQRVRDHFQEADKGIAVDATCGNGHDTEFLARLGFDQVIGFDVQETAIQNTQQRIDTAGLANVQLVQRGHETMQEYIDGTISCAMFNFGYLPKADKSITTQRNTSVQALESASALLREDGIICLLCYPGHQEGAYETLAIQNWLSQLDGAWRSEEYLSNHPSPSSPVLYTLLKC